MTENTSKVRQANELMTENLIVKHRAGSHAYGTNIATSDEDYRGIFCADPVNVRTPFFPIREVEDTSEEDTKLYEVATYLKLCTDCNPNIIETLWVDESDVTFTSPAYELLREHRSKLLSSKAAFTFSGYAVSQLKRIKGHNKWINNPQSEEAPKPYQFLSLVQWFGLEKKLHVDFNQFREGYRLIPYSGHTYGVVKWEGHRLWDESGNLNDKTDGIESRGELMPLMILKWNKEEYRSAKEKHEQYWTWKKNRNAARNELEEKYGYDSKHAMHLVRLLRMGQEILETGIVQVRRPDAQELLAIRNGSWTYDQLLQYSEQMDLYIRETLYKKTSLPKTADIKFAAKLLMDVQELVWSSK